MADHSNEVPKHILI